MILKNVFILCFVTSVVYLEPLIKNANNYGHYILRFDHYKDCKGPKAKNLTSMTTDMDATRLVGFVNFTFFDDAKIDDIKVQVHNLKDNKKSFLWNYKLSDPCKHFAIAAMIKQQLKSNNCLVKKGNYSSQINFGEVMHSFLGESFFYGTYFFKADLISKKGNIACFNATLTFMKKAST